MTCASPEYRSARLFDGRWNIRGEESHLLNLKCAYFFAKLLYLFALLIFIYMDDEN